MSDKDNENPSKVEIARLAAKSFYRQPNYDAYSKPPTYDHLQVVIRYQEKQAEVDIGIQRIILALWTLGFDTAGSCQEKADTGLAYVGFPVPGDGKRFHQLLKENGIDSILAPFQMTVGSSSGKEIKIPAANVRFESSLIAKIEVLLESKLE